MNIYEHMILTGTYIFMLLGVFMILFVLNQRRSSNRLRRSSTFSHLKDINTNSQVENNIYRIRTYRNNYKKANNTVSRILDIVNKLCRKQVEYSVPCRHSSIML